MKKKTRTSLFRILWSNRGQSAVTLAVSTAAIILMTGFTTDIAKAFLTRQVVQKLADTGVMAAVVKTPTQGEAIKIVLGIANLNEIGASQYIAINDIEVGDWDFATRTFTPNANPDPIDGGFEAVRVTFRRIAATNTALDFVIAPMIGINSIDIIARATAAAVSSECGIIGINNIHMGGQAYVDSYHSSAGPYSPATAGENGTICSDGPITLNGQVEIHGSARPGEGEEVSTTPQVVVTGSEEPREEPLNVPPLDFGSVETNNDNDDIPLTSLGRDPIDAAGNLSISGNETLDLPPGIYFFGDVSITSDDAQINISGPTLIYMTGTLLVAGGGFVNSSEIPSNLQIYSVGPSVVMAGHSDFHGAVIAPDANIAITGQGELFGLFIGDEVLVPGQGTLHVDLDLRLFGDALRPKPVLVE